MNETLFYVCGITLAISAVVTSFIGLKNEDFPGKFMPVVVLWFAIFVGGAGTFAVLHGKDEDKAHAVEYKKAGEEIESEQTSGPYGSEGATATGTEEGESNTKEEGEVAEESEGSEAGGGGTSTTLELEASETELAFNTKKLETKAGQVTIDLNNPSTIPHNIGIEKEGEEIAVSETEAGGETSVTATLEPGTYTFLCTVPGHAEAGMEGTLTVK